MPEDEPDAPVSRAELERALRSMAITNESLRDDLIQLAAQVVALQAELDRRLDGVDAAVNAAIPDQLLRIRVADDRSSLRLQLGDAVDKYQVSNEHGPPCLELLPICKGRCCSLHFPLSTQDLEEGVIRWDYGRPYLIKQRPEDNRCVHSDPDGGHCTVYEHRPAPCRKYDCRNDARIWKDFATRELAEESPYARKEGEAPTELDLVERVRTRQVALALETFSLGTNEPRRK